MKLSAAECASLWNQASPDGGPITQSQAAAYVTDFKAANPDGDKTLEKAEFSKACANGLVKSGASSGASSGEVGTAAASRTLRSTSEVKPLYAHSGCGPRSDALASPLGRPIACCCRAAASCAFQRVSFSTAAARGAK